MTFKKAKLPIRTTQDEVMFVDGYTFEACFSTGQLFTVGVWKNNAKDALHKTNWIVTDVNTGRAICEADTRIAAVKKFQDYYCSRLERMVYNNDHWSAALSCHENYYEHMSAELARLICESGVGDE